VSAIKKLLAEGDPTTIPLSVRHHCSGYDLMTADADQRVLDERGRRLECVVAGAPVVNTRPLLPVLAIGDAERQRVRSALNIFLWQCLAQAQSNRAIVLSDDMLRDYGADIAALPNVTPNGLILPKRENLSGFNMVQKEAIGAFDALGISDRIARVQYPVNVRLQSGLPDAAIDRRPRASSKPHSDIWAGDPSSGILVFLSVLGDPIVSGIHFYRPKAFPASFLRPLDDYNEGLPLMGDATEIGRFDESGWFLADSYVLHQTVKAGAGLRISLDFRFISKERVPSDTDEDATRRPFFISVAEWKRLGSSTLITTQESMHSFDPAGKKGPYTIGYPVKISLIDIDHSHEFALSKHSA
jgi:hypothetical protein